MVPEINELADTKNTPLQFLLRRWKTSWWCASCSAAIYEDVIQVDRRHHPSASGIPGQNSSDLRSCRRTPQPKGSNNCHLGNICQCDVIDAYQVHLEEEVFVC